MTRSRSSLPRGTWFVLLGVASVVLVAGVWSGLRKSDLETGTATVAPPSPTSEQIHGSAGDALDWSSTPGVSLSAALARMPRNVALPEEKAAGGIEKVVVDETAADSEGNPGLLILYGSGIKLMVAPGVRNLDEVEATPGAPFQDGSSKAFKRRVVGGRDSLVAQGGVQVLPHGRYKMEPRIMWNMGGYSYSLVAGAESVTVGDLMKVAQSIR